MAMMSPRLKKRRSFKMILETFTARPKAKVVSPIRYITEYDYPQVEGLLDNYLDGRNLRSQWSNRRKGWIIPCPGAGCHSEHERTDDCTVFYTRKDNGFIYISGRCRHISCGSDVTSFCKELNKDWGIYLNQNYVDKQSKKGK